MTPLLMGGLLHRVTQNYSSIIGAGDFMQGYAKSFPFKGGETLHKIFAALKNNFA